MADEMLALGVGLAIGLSGAAVLMASMDQMQGGGQQQSGFGAYNVMRDSEGRIEAIESHSPPEFSPL